MATVPAQRNWTAGEVVTAAMLNSNVRDSVNYLITGRPHAVLRQSVTQTISSGSFTPVTFDAEDRDTDSAHSTVANTSRYTAATAGWYHITGVVAWTGSAGGARRGSAWAVNGAQVPGTQIMASPVGVNSMGTPVIATDVFLNVGDILELVAFQDTGANLNTVISGSLACRVTIRWISTA